jgi:signal peptidase
MVKGNKVANETPNSKSPTRSRTKWSTTAKWIRTVVASVLVLAVLAVAAVVAVALVQGTWQVNPVVSGSMRPGFAVGGAVISERIPVDQVSLRDVIVFKNPDNPADLMVHRIVKLTRSKSGQLVIKTKGDANNVQDPWTLTISGKYAYEVRWSLPLLGYVAVAYQNDRGLVLLGVGIVLLASAASVIFRPRRRDEVTDDREEGEGESPTDPGEPSPNKTDESRTPASAYVFNSSREVQSPLLGIDAERIDGDDPMAPDEPRVRSHWSDRY